MRIPTPRKSALKDFGSVDHPDTPYLWPCRSVYHAFLQRAGPAERQSRSARAFNRVPDVSYSGTLRSIVRYVRTPSSMSRNVRSAGDHASPLRVKVRLVSMT